MASAITSAYLYGAAQASVSEKRALICTPPGPAQSHRPSCTVFPVRKMHFQRPKFSNLQKYRRIRMDGVVLFVRDFQPTNFDSCVRKFGFSLNIFAQKFQICLQIRSICAVRQMKKIRRISPPRWGLPAYCTVSKVFNSANTAHMSRFSKCDFSPSEHFVHTSRKIKVPLPHTRTDESVPNGILPGIMKNPTI